MFASMEHRVRVEIKVHFDPMLHGSKHRLLLSVAKIADRLPLNEIESWRKTDSLITP